MSMVGAGMPVRNSRGPADTHCCMPDCPSRCGRTADPRAGPALRIVEQDREMASHVVVPALGSHGQSLLASLPGPLHTAGQPSCTMSATGLREGGIGAVAAAPDQGRGARFLVPPLDRLAEQFPRKNEHEHHGLAQVRPAFLGLLDEELDLRGKLVRGAGAASRPGRDASPPRPTGASGRGSTARDPHRRVRTGSSDTPVPAKGAAGGPRCAAARRGRPGGRRPHLPEDGPQRIQIGCLEEVRDLPLVHHGPQRRHRDGLLLDVAEAAHQARQPVGKLGAPLDEVQQLRTQRLVLRGRGRSPSCAAHRSAWGWYGRGVPSTSPPTFGCWCLRRGGRRSRRSSQSCRTDRTAA